MQALRYHTLSVTACGGATSPKGGGKFIVYNHMTHRTNLAPPMGELARRSRELMPAGIMQRATAACGGS